MRRLVIYRIQVFLEILPQDMAGQIPTPSLVTNIQLIILSIRLLQQTQRQVITLLWAVYMVMYNLVAPY